MIFARFYASRDNRHTKPADQTQNSFLLIKKKKKLRHRKKQNSFGETTCVCHCKFLGERETERNRRLCVEDYLGSVSKCENAHAGMSMTIFSS